MDRLQDWRTKKSKHRPDDIAVVTSDELLRRSSCCWNAYDWVCWRRTSSLKKSNHIPTLSIMKRVNRSSLKHWDICMNLMSMPIKYGDFFDGTVFVLLLSTRKDLLIRNPIARPRLPHEVLFVCGGWSGGSPTSAVELYDVSSNRRMKDYFFQPLRSLDSCR